jgi:IS30 family transposase
MNETLQQLLDNIPDRPPRSKLEPHAEVIRALRRKRRTYQEIAAFLQEHVQLSVAPSTIHDFVKRRARQAAKRQPELPELPVFPLSERSAKPGETNPGVAPPAVLPVHQEPPLFHFDAQEPLTLHPKPEEK